MRGPGAQRLEFPDRGAQQTRLPIDLPEGDRHEPETALHEPVLAGALARGLQDEELQLGTGGALQPLPR